MLGVQQVPNEDVNVNASQTLARHLDCEADFDKFCHLIIHMTEANERQALGDVNLGQQD